MALDPYKLCPCGGGKKVKFCCSKDIAHDLDQVYRMMEGDQRLAAFDRLTKLIKEKGERGCLLALKGSIALQLERIDDAKATIGKFVVEHPENPVALSQSALIETAEGNLHEAVTALQRALEQIDKDLPMMVYQAVGVLAHALAGHGEIIAARNHLLMQISFSDENAQQAVELLMKLQHSPELPLLLKQDWISADCPEGVEWEEPFAEAQKLTRRGTWLAAVEKLELLAQKYPGQPEIMRNIAVLRNSLGDREAMIEAWRRYAAMDNVALDDAVEAEALAQLLDPDSDKGWIDVVCVTYPVNDQERLLEVLTDDRSVARMPHDLAEFADEGEPPPKGAYWLLDRPVPTTGEGLTSDDVPVVVGELFLYGRQTDREPRLEFVADRTDDYDQQLARLAELLGDLAGPPENEEVTDQVGALTAALTWNWHFPQDTSIEAREAMIAVRNREVMLNRWTNLELSVLGGKRPKDVAGNSAYQAKVLAAIQLMELGSESSPLPSLDYNELRRHLDLPEQQAIDPEGEKVSHLPVIRLSRVLAEKLSDEDLTRCYARAKQCTARKALQHLAKELVQRDGMEVAKLIDAYQVLSHSCKDNQQAIAYLHAGRDLAVKEGDSIAHWLLAELDLRLRRGIIEECQAIMEQILSRHGKEPGIASGLRELLMGYGLMTPDGQMAGPAAQPRASAQAPTESLSEAGKIWTPEAEAAEQAEGKSKLWVPGMD